MLPELNAAGTKECHIFLPALLIPAHCQAGFIRYLTRTTFNNNNCNIPATTTEIASGIVRDNSAVSVKFPAVRNTNIAPEISARLSNIGATAPGQNNRCVFSNADQSATRDIITK